MKIKESNNKIAHIAWSPASLYPSYIASGTAADQADSSSFSTKATLDFLKIDLSNPNQELEQAASIATESRFRKLLWSEYSSANGTNVIVGGGENGKIYLYDHEKILAHSEKSCIQILDKHAASSTTGVGALDINPFQSNLLASGAGSSEIFIWDLNSPTTPMTPGAKLQPLDDINCLAWNHQVQHILGSTSSGKCVVWDLRKNESIIKVSDSMSKMRAKLVTWHPDVATQMCLSSDDDHTPFLQIWDLRFATAPVRVLEGHQRGILAFTWSTLDSNLLLSSAKDSRILCWNPNNATMNGEVLYELPTNSQWCFDLSWSKRSPNLFCASSFEGQTNVYSLMGGKFNVAQQTSSKIMDSFGVLDNSGNMQQQQVQQVQEVTQVVQQLKVAPKWMKRPCGASFAFGGKLVTFGRFSQDPNNPSEQVNAEATLNNQRVIVSQIVTDPTLVQNSYQLENVLQTNNFTEYCNYKVENAKNQSQSSIWNFILATFNQNKHDTYISLLGFNNESLEKRTSEFLNTNDHDLSSQVDSKLHLNGNSSVFDSDHAHHGSSTSTTTTTNTTTKSRLKSLSQTNDDDDTFSDIARSLSPVNLSFDSESESLISELLVLGQYEKVVDLLVQEQRFTDAILIANFFDKNLFVKTQQAYFRHHAKNKFSNLLEKFLNRDWPSIVKTCSLENWREALATVLTYTQDVEQATLCNLLGSRLELESNNSNGLLNACICYICSPDLDKFVHCWQKVASSHLDFSTDSECLLDLIEKVMILRYSLASTKQQQTADHTKLYAKLIEYAKLLADQGCFLNAYTYLNDLNDHSILVMKDRLFNSLDPNLVQQYRLRRPECPFKQTQQVYAKFRPSSVSSSSSNIAPQHKSNNNFMTNKPQQNNNNSYYNNNGSVPTASAYVDHTKSANALNTPFLPVASAGHPMPASSIYSAAAANSANMPYRSTTPAGLSKTLSQPPIVPLQQQQPQQMVPPQGPYFAPSNIPAAQPQQTLNSQINQSPPSYMHAKPPTAWNDPPLVAPKVRAPSAKETPPGPPEGMPQFFQPAAVPSAPSQYYFPQANSGLHNPSQSHQSIDQYQQPHLHQHQQQQYAPTMPNQYGQMMEGAQKPVAAPIVAAPQPQPVVVEKGPIPAEHQVIKNVLDSLLNNCMNATQQPVVRRKLEDVAKKLEVLYDKLRESSLSASVVQGLHAIIQYVRANDYQSAIMYHSNLVGTSNFSEISGFMPGIKVLIQSCQQMNVHA